MIELQDDLLEYAVSWLRGRVPASWTLQPRVGASDSATDLAIDISGGSVHTTVAVEVRRSLGPRDVERLFGSFGKTLRALSPHISLLVIAPWQSARTRELLEREGINYIDSTGNALLRLDHPAVYIRTDGASRSPLPRKRARARLRGAKAARLARALLDVSPPYGVRELAEAAKVNPGYASQILEALSDDAFIERSRRGGVESVDVGGLLARWSEEYDVFETNVTRTYIAPRGAAELLPETRQIDDVRLVVTGSFAAVRLAPVAAPALLCLYCDAIDPASKRLGLLPADEGANVALLAPFDPVVWERTSIDDGIRYAAVSQVAVDCLTGNGRMPAEGVALRDWMLSNESRWRLPTLAVLDTARAS
jgi:hypothetical protein